MIGAQFIPQADVDRRAAQALSAATKWSISQARASRVPRDEIEGLYTFDWTDLKQESKDYWRRIVFAVMDDGP